MLLFAQENPFAPPRTDVTVFGFVAVVAVILVVLAALPFVIGAIVNLERSRIPLLIVALVAVAAIVCGFMMLVRPNPQAWMPGAELVVGGLVVLLCCAVAIRVLW